MSNIPSIWGSKILESYQLAFDAIVARNLREKGATIVGLRLL